MNQDGELVHAPPRAITLTAFNRPAYLREVLASLRANNHLDQFHLHIALEPGCSATLEVCRAIDFIPTTIHQNVSLLGVRGNPYRLLQQVFAAGYDSVVYCEDDVVLSPDAIDLSLWYLNHGTLPHETRCLCLHNGASTVQQNPGVVGTHPISDFASLGFVTTRFQWETFFQKRWHAHAGGWDWGITSGAGYIAAPKVSRSHHIGRFGGTHYVAADHDRIYADNYRHPTGTPEGGYHAE
jgi:hypothetical protein